MKVFKIKRLIYVTLALLLTIACSMVSPRTTHPEINTHVIAVDVSAEFDYDKPAYVVKAGDPVTFTAQPTDGGKKCGMYLPESKAEGPAPFSTTLQTKMEWSGATLLITVVCDWGNGYEMDHSQVIHLYVE